MTVTIIVAMFVIFVVPWIIIAIVQIKRRMRRIHVQKQKENQQQQLLMITDYGRELRRAMRAPNGDLYSDPDGREAKLRIVDRNAPQMTFSDCRFLKATQVTCAICVEDFTEKDQVRLTACNHVFHSQCLMMWAKQKIWATVGRSGSPNCPNCNQSMLEAPLPILGSIESRAEVVGDGLLSGAVDSRNN